ncbi:Cytidine deaminase 5 [Chamberlinius hualienensis]
MFVCSRCEKSTEFECPEQFGYYPDSNDCTRYFVCVFGGALHESCTGGLFFSVDLQTCDWPRNVKCNNGARTNSSEATNVLGSSNNSNRPSSSSTITNSMVQSISSSSSTTSTTPRTSSSHFQPSVSVPRRVPPHNSPSSQTVSSSQHPSTSTRANIDQSMNSDGAKEDAAIQLTADEELILEGFTEVIDVPRTVAKVKCIGCPTVDSTRLQLDDDPGTNSNHVVNNPTLGTQQPPVQVGTVHSSSGEDAANSGIGTEDNSDQHTPQSPHYEYYDPDEFEGNDEDNDNAFENRGKTPSITNPTTTSTSPPPIVPPPPPPQRRGKNLRDIIPDTPAKRCDPSICNLPDCFCGGNQISPGGLKTDDIPQMVLITFDDAVNDINWPLYEQLFYKGRKNPNGCSISATFYVSHEWTDYGKVQTLYSDGNEIGSHSITHAYGEDFAKEKWEEEMYGQKEILSTYAGIKYEDIQGMRAPFLQIGGNSQYAMLYDNNFTYDSSMPVYENKPPYWPYTLDYSIPHECMIPPCPTHSYPGVWEIPLVMMVDLNGGRCSMADACSNPPTAEGVYKMLVKNFERHYLTNRAPFGLFYHSAWFAIPHHREGFEAFLDALVTMDDVFIITSTQLIEWMRKPTPLSKIKDFLPWQCNNRDRVPPCKKPKVCNLWFKGGVRYMKTCQPCPQVYPWANNTGSKNKTTTIR